MNDRNDDVLAANATARIEDSRCKGRGERWNELERAHAAAATPRESSDIVVEVVLGFCSGCPALVACAQWAATDHYTGLAAGAPYKDGRRKPPRWVSQRAGRPPATARAS